MSDLGSGSPVETTHTGGSTTPTATPRDLSDVFFDFDQARLRGDALQTLQSNGQVLSSEKSFGVVLEGHCDELGTVEYNLALGEQRARAVERYLVGAGVDGARLSVVSYGEERPFAKGHDEQAWSQNRRVHFVKS